MNKSEQFLGNNMNRNRFIGRRGIVLMTCLLVFFIPIICHAQESIRGLSENPVLIKWGEHMSRLKVGSDTIVLKLPFIDDFSSTNISPDQHKWIDNYVYINSTYPVNPPSIGVATFDALDENGHLYSGSDTTTAFKADQLTSRQIDLNFPGRSDIFMSFFYEPGGIGSNEGVIDGTEKNRVGPESSDSLILEFYSPSNQEWRKIWGAPGDTMAHNFRQKMVHIDQPEYLQKGFRFRFRNLVSLEYSFTAPDGKNNTNNDLWHLDYVRLDTGRNELDTAMIDVAFTEPLQSLLKNYTSMPWDHYKVAFVNVIKPQIKVTYKNNDNYIKGHHVLRNFEINDLYGDTKISFTADEADILPGQTIVLKKDFSNPFITTFTDTALFEVRSYLHTDVNDLRSNDTIRFRQVFSNYFAYDDGSAEFGYGLENIKGGSVAYQFNSYLSDTLVAVRFFFTSSKWTKNQSHYFKLAIWADNNDKPGKLLYKSSDYSVDSIMTNEFNTFKLDTSLIIKGKYYVGWVQSDYFYMNIGYDRNNNSDQFSFYLVNGNWYNSQLHGSLMIRPVFRHLKSIVLGNKELISKSLTVFPNPASDYITITFEAIQESGRTSYSIYNAKGMKVMQSTFSGNNTIDVSNLTSGFYILLLAQEKTNFAPVKFLIQR